MVLPADSMPASARVRIPLAATVPKSTIPAPPRTGCGTSETNEPRTGKRPSRIRIPPPAATTKRLRIFVSATSPMFWAKALQANPLKTGLSAEASPSARRPAVSVRSSASRSTIRPRASMSAVDSVIATTMTMQNEKIAAASKTGAPKWNGDGSAKIFACRTAPKSASPSGKASRVPMARPTSSESCCQKPRSSLLQRTTATRVSAASPMARMEP